MEIPVIEEIATAWKVSFPDGREVEYGSLVTAVREAQIESDIIRFLPFQKIERAPYTGSIEHDAMYKRRP